MLPSLAHAFIPDTPPLWLLLMPPFCRLCVHDAHRKKNVSEHARPRIDPTGMNLVPPRPGHTRSPERPLPCCDDRQPNASFFYQSLLLAAERERARLQTSDCLSSHPDIYDPGRHIDGTRCESHNCPGGG